MLLSDRPIVCAAEDQLGFDPFARTLAKGLREMTPAEGLVVALHAPWGSGKTSVLNLVERDLAVLDLAALTDQSFDCLQSLAASRPMADDAEEATRAHQWEMLVKQHKGRFRSTVVRFNPWYFSGQEPLFKAFFGVLGTELSIANNKGVAAAVGALLKRGAEAGAAAGAGIGLLTAGPAGAAGGAAIGGFWGKLLNDRFETAESLDASLEALRAALSASEQRIIVIVDDVDRLLPEELRQMLTLIKSLGNLPNITYLLAYDQAEVAGLLKRAGVENADYLEKIVQVSFQLPTVDRSALQSMFFQRLDVIRKNRELSSAAAHRWSAAYHLHIDRYLKTPRDITRLCNSLQVVWPAVEEEVDWTDLVVLETIRMHEPHHYRLVLDHLDLLTASDSAWLAGKDWAKPLLPNDSNSASPDRLKSALISLFPTLGKEWSAPRSSEGDAEAHRDRRIRCPEYARNYFALSPSPNQFSTSEIKALVQAADPAAAYRAIFDRAKERRTTKGLSMVSRLLEQITEQITPECPLTDELARAILGSAEEAIGVQDADRSFFVVDNRERLLQLFSTALRVVDDGKRAQLIKVWAANGLAATFLVPFIGFHADARSGDTLLPASATQALKRLALKMARAASREPDILTKGEAARLLFSWARLGTDKEVSTWLMQQTSANDLINLARIIPSEVHSSSEGIYLVVRRKSWSRLLDLDEFDERLRQLPEGEGADIVSRFRAAMVRSVDE